MGVSSEDAVHAQHRRLSLEDFETFLDRLLYFIGRTWEILVILAFIGLLCVLRKPLAKLLEKDIAKLRKKCSAICRCRTLKRCFAFIMSCGRSSSGSSPGYPFAKLANAEQMLKVTFFRCMDVRQRFNFYFEGWTEPQETTCKNTKMLSGRGTVDMGQEHICFDWHGDEDEFVLHLCEFTSPILTDNKSVGEVRIPRVNVEKYAMEAMNDPGNFTAGTRSFDVKPIHEEHHKQAAVARKKHVGKGQDIMQIGVNMAVESKFGNSEELERLRKENNELRDQLVTYSHGNAPNLTGKKPEPLMKVVARFEIVPRRESNASALFPSSSFDTRRNSSYP